MSRRLGAVLAATVWLAAASTAHASVLSDNLASFGFLSETATANNWLTAGFCTDAQAYDLTSVVLPIKLVAGSGGTAEVSIYTSVGAGVGQPGALVGLLTSTGSIPASKTDVTFTATGIELSPSTTYWVVLRVQVAGNAFNWYWTPDDIGTGVGFLHTWGFSDDAGGGWTTFDTAPLQMQVNADEVSPWTDLGFALPGADGAPLLAGTGTLEVGSSGSIRLSSAAPSAPALLFVAPTSTPTSFKGGTLVPLPSPLILPLPTDSMGDALLAWDSWPSGLSGMSLYLHCAVHDSAAVKGVALSNALGADMP